MSIRRNCIDYVAVSSLIYLFFVMARFVTLLIKILLVWLLIHFFMHTRITFWWWIDAGALRAWKEWVIWLLFLSAFSLLLTKPDFLKTLFSHKRFVVVVIAVLVWIWWTFLIHAIVIQDPVSRRAMAMRYDYLWWIIFLLWRWFAFYLWPIQSEKIITRHGRIIKRVLLLALLVWCVVAIKPWTMKLFGFNNYVFEWTVGLQPPAVYYTHINYGLPRSQFFFERPTTFWFWLTAFFPFFFMQFLYRRSWKETWARWLIYALNIIVTFSRAAWWSWIIIVVLCIGFTTTLPRKKLIVRYGIPLFWLFALILAVWREQIALRWYSNYGHMTMVKRGVEMLVEKPLWWRWGASAWPWSHWEWWLAFNPENQFLQILIEFGTLGALPWLFIWCVVLLLWLVWPYRHQKRAVALSLGMISLTISWMVLHSFADRMVVYPFMIISWLALFSFTDKHWVEENA